MPKNAFTKFEGIVTPLLSPVDKNERLIAKDLVKLVRYQIESGVQALLAPSGSGEFFALPDEERQRLVEIVVEAAAGNSGCCRRYRNGKGALESGLEK
jgi:dihydrodipicolinate synthase/N-acetylneuraminate lyase